MAPSQDSYSSALSSEFGASVSSLSPDNSVGSHYLSDDGNSVGSASMRKRRIPPKLYRIGELVDYSGMSRQTIHNYTTMGLLRESRWSQGGHRLYDESVFERIDRILQLKAKRKSLEFIRQYFTRLDGQ